MSGSTITGTITVAVTLGNAGYRSPLTVEQAGAVIPLQNTVAGVLVNSGLFTNDGTVVGGGAYRGEYPGQTAGNGVNLTSGEIINNGLFLGGSGEFPDFTTGAGIDVSGGTLKNNGTVMGGAAVDSSGLGLSLSAGTVINTGTISGNTGSSVPDPPPQTGETGGTGVSMAGGEFTNTETGLITGSDGGPGGNGSEGGLGVLLAAGTMLNDGTIEGGSSGTFNGAGGTAVYVDGGTLFNSGTISGGIGTYSTSSFVKGFGGGVFMAAGYVVNDGIIADGSVSSGNPGADLAGDVGVFIDGGTFVDNGVVADLEGRPGNFAMAFGPNPATLVIAPSATFIGNVAGNYRASDTLILGAGATPSDGTLDMGNSFSGFSTIGFAAGADWHLTGTVLELADRQTISGLTAQDTIFVDGITAVSDTYVPGAGLEIFDGVVRYTLGITGSFTTSSFVVMADAGQTEVELLCYLRGTRILTPAGEVPVENLSLGDAVVTRLGGYQKIKWIGRQSFSACFIKNNRDQIPVRIRAGALGPGLPKRDLFVSPGHSMLLDDVLVIARTLVNGITITQDDLPEEVHYYQLEFDKHDCVLAEGSWSESFCDFGGLRNQFHNVAEFWKLYPEHVAPANHLMCALRPEGGPDLGKVLMPVAARATAMVRLGEVQGVIDEIRCSGLLRGWAIDTTNLELPVLLEATLNGKSLIVFLACDFRADLLAAGFGQGRCAFEVHAPRIAEKSLLQISVRRFGTQEEISKSPSCFQDKDIPWLKKRA